MLEISTPTMAMHSSCKGNIENRKNGATELVVEILSDAFKSGSSLRVNVSVLPK